MTEEKKQEKIEEKVEEKKEEVQAETVEKKEKPEERPKEEKEKKEEKEEPEVVEVPKKFKKIVDEISNLSVLDLAELVKILEKKFGVTTTVPMAAAPAVAPGTPTEVAPAEEKTIFNIELKEVGDKKIEVIKAVRDITGKGLKEAKDLVDAAPQTIKEGVKKEEAEEIKKKLEGAGAKVELK